MAKVDASMSVDDLVYFDEEQGKYTVDQDRLAKITEARSRVLQSNNARRDELIALNAQIDKTRQSLASERRRSNTRGFMDSSASATDSALGGRPKSSRDLEFELANLLAQRQRLHAGGAFQPMPWLGDADWTKGYESAEKDFGRPPSASAVVRAGMREERRGLEQRRDQSYAGGSSGSLGLSAKTPRTRDIERKLAALPDPDEMGRMAAARREADAQRPGYAASGMNPFVAPPEPTAQQARSMPLPLPMTEASTPQTGSPEPQARSMPLPLPMTEARTMQTQAAQPVPSYLTETPDPFPAATAAEQSQVQALSSDATLANADPTSRILERRRLESARRWEQARGGPENAWTGDSPIGTEPEVQQVMGFVGPPYPAFAPQTPKGSGRPIDYSDPDLYDSMGDGRPPSRPASGTLDPASQPIVRNSDGTASTVRTIGIEVDGNHVLIPTVSPDGTILTDEQAIDMFRSSGRHLGVFSSREESDAAGRSLSQQESRRIAGIDTSNLTLAVNEYDENGNRLEGDARVRATQDRLAMALGQQAEASGRSSGRRVTDLAREAMGQMTNLANRMAQGRGGADIRDGVSMYEQAIASGDENAIMAARNRLDTLLNGRVFNVFEQRIAQESGMSVEQLRASGMDIRGMFLDQLGQKISTGQAGMDYRSGGGMPMQSPTTTAQDPRSRGARPQQPSAPVRTPSGGTVRSYGTVDSAIKDLDSMRPGELIMVAGSPYTVVPSRDRYGNPTFRMQPAVSFGGGNTNTPAIAVPDPGNQTDPEAWASSLSRTQRDAMLDSLTNDPRMRSNLSREMVERIDRLRRSREGLFTNAMSGRDRQAALAQLQSEENQILFAAMQSVGSVARGGAFTEGLIAEQNRQEELANRLDEGMINDEIKRLGEERAFARRQSEAELNQQYKIAEEERKRAIELEDARIEDLKNNIPIPKEVVVASNQRNEMIPKDYRDPVIEQKWTRMSPDQQEIASRLFESIVMAADTSTPIPVTDKSFQPVPGQPQTDAYDEQGEPVVGPAPTTQAYRNPEGYLKRADIMRVIDMVSRIEGEQSMPPPPKPGYQPDPGLMEAAMAGDQQAIQEIEERQQQDNESRSKIQSANAEKWAERRAAQYMEVVEFVGSKVPGFMGEMIASASPSRGEVSSHFEAWQRDRFAPAVDAHKRGELSDEDLREVVGKLHSWALVTKMQGGEVKLSGELAAALGDRDRFVQIVLNNRRK